MILFGRGSVIRIFFRTINGGPPPPRRKCCVRTEIKDLLYDLMLDLFNDKSCKMREKPRNHSQLNDVCL